MAVAALRIEDFVPPTVWSDLVSSSRIAEPDSGGIRVQLATELDRYRSTTETTIKTGKSLAGSLDRMALAGEQIAQGGAVEIRHLDDTIDTLYEHSQRVRELGERARSAFRSFARTRGGKAAAVLAGRQSSAYFEIVSAIDSVRNRLLAVRNGLLINDLATIQTGLVLDDW